MANFHVISGAGDKLDMPVVRTIHLSDLFAALRQGAADFWDKPSHYVMLTLIYPIVGIVLTVWMSGYYTWPLLYPLVGGFALVGPFAAIGLYEISRRREQGLDTSWSHAFEVLPFSRHRLDRGHRRHAVRRVHPVADRSAGAL